MALGQHLSGIASLAGILILILDGKTALMGARAGIELCLRSVIPALFPFFVLSALLIRSGSTLPLPGRLGKFLGIPTGMERVLIPAFLGGYPVGAQSVTQAYHSGRLSKPEAERLLAFCSNAGPAFLFGVIGQLLPGGHTALALWCIHIAGAVAAARCFPGASTAREPGLYPEVPQKDGLSGAIATMGTVCGWIILFRILIAFLDRWFLWLVPAEVRVAVIGMLELTNGCCELTTIGSFPMRFILCSGMLAMGGICVTMQTVSVTKGLSLHWYCLGKLVQLFVSLILSAGFAYRSILPLSGLLFLWPVRKIKIRGRNRLVSGV